MYVNTAIGNAMREYGLGNFRYGVIKSCASKEELNYWEKFYIATLKTKFPYGYNRTDGGSSGWKHTDESRAKMSMKRMGNKNRLGKSHTAQIRAQMVVTRTGRHQPVATCAKIGISRRGYSPFKNLLAEIDARQWSYRTLAKFLGISDMSVSAKMRCKQKFTTNEIKMLEELLGKPIEYLLQRFDE